MALAGPRSRSVLERVAAGVDVGNASLPHMGMREIAVAGVKARIFRISFSGELAYEINVPADQGTAVWEALLAAGAPDGITAYGTEAMGVMRIEKGHVAGAELDGNTTAEDLGLGRLVSGKKDFIGRRSLTRPALAEASRLRLVGLAPVDSAQRIRSGAQLVEDPSAPAPVKMLGHVTSTAFSPSLGHSIALALLSGGLERKGAVLQAAFPLRNETVAVRVIDPVFLDPQGERLHA
jgi:sarcosine oxidase subunit alpha